jgi:polar amino acid transport system ATP-binding protein
MTARAAGLSIDARTPVGDLRLDVALEVAAGECVALAGPSGAGKTSVLRIVAGLLEPAHGRVACAGEIWLDTDRRIGVPAERRRCGYLFQEYALFGHLSAWRNVAYALHEAPRAQREPRARELLARFGLAGREGEHPDRLSGGQQQRVAIARALATRPRALLLDEVTSALDPELVGEVLEVVRELKAEGMTMLIATHEMGFAREVADEVCFLHDGLIIERGDPERIFTAPEHADTQRFLRRLLEAGRL